MAEAMGDAAERYRMEGNEHFRSGRFYNAIKSYTKSLESRETSAVLANRAQAYLNTKQNERALMDAAKAMELDGTNIKAMFRYAKALANLQLYEIASETLSKIEELDPNNKEVAKLKDTVKGKVNCTELRLLCGDRDEFLRAKLPLKEIKSIKLVRTKLAERKLKETPPKTPSEVLPPPPSSSFRFIADFQALKDKPAVFVNYFMAIDKQNYEELLGEVIETEMLEVLIRGFDAVVNWSNITQIIGCLIYIADVSRFDVALMFLDARTKDVLKCILDRYPINENQLAIVKGLYAL